MPTTKFNFPPPHTTPTPINMVHGPIRTITIIQTVCLLLSRQNFHILLILTIQALYHETFGIHTYFVSGFVWHSRKYKTKYTGRKTKYYYACTLPQKSFLLLFEIFVEEMPKTPAKKGDVLFLCHDFTIIYTVNRINLIVRAHSTKKNGLETP